MDPSLQSLLAINLSFSLYAYYKTTKIFDVIFLVPISFYSLIMIATVLNVPMSYLEDTSDVAYYPHVIFLDLVAYTALYFAIKLLKADEVLKSARQFLNQRVIFYFGCVLIILNLIIVFPYLGQPYSVVTSKHTPLSELGWILVAVFIATNSHKAKIQNYIIITLLLILLSLPFGARMQSSFAVMSIIIYLSQFVSKTRILILFFILTTSSLILGVLRDLVLLDRSAVAILTGFNQGAILRTSSVILQYNESLSFLESVINTLGTFFLYPVSGTLFTDQNIYLNIELQNFKPIQGNGGNFGTLMYYYFGTLFPLVILILTIVLYQLNALRFLLIFAVVTSFRWQQYNFIPLLRLYPIIFILGALMQMLPKKRSDK